MFANAKTRANSPTLAVNFGEVVSQQRIEICRLRRIREILAVRRSIVLIVKLGNSNAGFPQKNQIKFNVWPIAIIAAENRGDTEALPQVRDEGQTIEGFGGYQAMKAETKKKYQHTIVGQMEIADLTRVDVALRQMGENRFW